MGKEDAAGPWQDPAAGEDGANHSADHAETEVCLHLEREEARRHLEIILRDAPTEGYFAVSLFSHGGAPAHVQPLPFMGPDSIDAILSVAESYSTIAGFDPDGAVLCPPPVLFRKAKGLDRGNVAWVRVIRIDLDTEATAKLARIESLFGPATMIVWTGSLDQNGDPRLHIYYLLTEAATDPDAIDEVDRINRLLAEEFSGDRASAPVNHAMRMPGSWNYKDRAKPMPCRISAYRPEVMVDRRAVIQTLMQARHDRGEVPEDDSNAGTNMAGTANGAELRGDPDALADAMRFVPNADLPYEAWLGIGYGLKGGLGDAGWGLFEEFSRSSSKNNPAETRRTWKAIKADRKGAGTIYYLAMKNGWKPPPEMILNPLNRDDDGVDFEQMKADLLRSAATKKAAQLEAELAAQERADEVENASDATSSIFRILPRPTANILEPGGFMRDCLSEILARSARPQPIMALAAAMSVAGRWLVVATPARPGCARTPTPASPHRPVRARMTRTNS